MHNDVLSLKQIPVTVDAGAAIGDFDHCRCALGHGGINDHPLMPHVVEAVSALRPRLVRIFLQEFFAIYPARDTFDWSRLDPYMDSFARTGATVVAAITIKPPVLFSKVDQRQWQPSSWEEYQSVITQLVRRYSVERPIVSHWEIGNEFDIGETGGCPFLIEDPNDYCTLYERTVAPVLAAFPNAKVGGPALAGCNEPYLSRLVEFCAQKRLPLDFISWHIYDDDPARIVRETGVARQIASMYPGTRPELFLTEYSSGFKPFFVAEMAQDPARAAAVARGILDAMDAGLDYSYYYHIQDQAFFPEQFAPFYKELAIMHEHWNEKPHRFGLFSVNGEVRPQFFVYWMLARMSGQRLACECGESRVRTLATQADGRTSLLVVNYDVGSDENVVATVRLNGLAAGVQELTQYRIDGQQRWSRDDLTMTPVEQREMHTPAAFTTYLYCPANSVTLLELQAR